MAGKETGSTDDAWERHDLFRCGAFIAARSRLRHSSRFLNESVYARHRRSQTKGPASCGASSIRENRAAVLPAPRQNGGVRGRRRINAEGFRWLEPPYTREEQRLLWKPPHIRLTSRLMVSLLLRIERESQGRVRVCRNVDDIQEAMEDGLLAPGRR